MAVGSLWSNGVFLNPLVYKRSVVVGVATGAGNAIALC